MKRNKTRIAPTPSGFLHVGNILSFSLTVALARQADASILLRIDDLDRERFSPEYLGDIFDTLQFLDIPWDEGPTDSRDFAQSWSQLHRMALYEEALDRLRRSGELFACTCTRSQLAMAAPDSGYPGTCRERNIPLDTPGVNWRLRTGNHLPPEMRDFVVRKKDGFPAYQLTSLIDDIHFGVDLIVRGEDLRNSSLAQGYLAERLSAIGFQTARFVHHPLLMTAAGEKLSKSAGATSIQYLRNQGQTRAEIFSLIARLSGSIEPARNWDQLATLLFAQGYASGR